MRISYCPDPINNLTQYTKNGVIPNHETNKNNKLHKKTNKINVLITDNKQGFLTCLVPNQLALGFRRFSKIKQHFVCY